MSLRRGIGRIENTCEKCDLDELEIDTWMAIRVGLTKVGRINWDEESLKLNSKGSNTIVWVTQSVGNSVWT